MIAKIKNFLNSLIEQGGTAPAVHESNVAIASLLCEVCLCDHLIAAEEENAIVKTLSKLFLIEDEKAKELLNLGKEAIKSSNSLFDFTSQLKELDHDARIKLISAMWEVAYADNYLDPIEESIIRKVASLIYVGHSEFIRAKLAVISSTNSHSFY